MDCSPLHASAHGIFWARILEWVAISFFKGPSWPRDQTRISCGSCTAGRFFTTEPLGSLMQSHALKTIQRTERWRIGAFELWFWRRLLRVTWAARRSSLSILKEVKWKSLSCVGLCNRISSSVYEILQARKLGWVVVPFSRESSQPRGSNPGLPLCRQILYCLSHQGSPILKKINPEYKVLMLKLKL